MIARLRAQRVEIGDQVPAHAIGVDQLDDRRFLGDFGVARGVMPGSVGLLVRLPAHRHVRHAQMLEDLFVEAVLAVQQRLHAAQEHARIRRPE